MVQLDIDLAETAIVILVFGDVGKQIITMHVITDPAHSPRQIICVVNEKTAGLVSQLTEATARIKL